MKLTIILTGFLSLSLLSCNQETPKVKHKKSMVPSYENLKDIQVDNAEDPVCHMKTAEYLKDTVKYKQTTYGFCSSGCKEEFKKNPEHYVR